MTVADELTISGVGSHVVASDELRFHQESLRRLADELATVRVSVAVVDDRIHFSRLVELDASLSAAAAEQELQRAVAILGRCEGDARTMSVALGTAMELYGWGEAFTEAAARHLAAQLGYALGALAPIIILSALPVITASAATALVAMMISGTDLAAWLRQHNATLTNPTTVSLIRAAIMSSDDFLGGALRLPPPVVAALGDEGLGLAGLTTSAALLVLMANSAGALRETGVSATRTQSSPGHVAQTVSDRVSRLPDPGGSPGGEQVRIDRYSLPGSEDRFEVYIAGTVDFGIATSEPWDMTSNVNGVGGLPAGSYRAVLQAMADAGVTADTPLVVTGYSQGGLVASMIAASGDYDVHGVITFGAPAGQVPIPPDVPVLTIRHTDDLVPATGGYDTNTHALVIEREAYAGRLVPTDVPVPAHQLSNYERTAALIDEAQSRSVRDALDTLADFGAGSTSVETSMYRAERIDPVATGRDRGR